MRRVLAIGLDAADLGLLERLAAAGRLHHLQRVLGDGAAAEVHHDWPYRAELPWTEFLTGRDGWSNRYWGTVRYDPQGYGVTEGGAHVADPFYALDGLRVVAFDVPHAVLSPRVHGLQVTAWGAHSPQYPRASRPAGLLDELDRTVGPHPAFDADSQPGWWSDAYLTRLVAALLEGARRRAEGMVRLLEREPDWQLALTVFSEPHSAGHHLWHGVDRAHPLHGHPGAPAAAARLEAVYQGVDRAVGRLVEAAGPEACVVAFAVHGTQANGGDLLGLHLAPELLHRTEHGWARVRNPRRDPLDEGGWVEPAGRRPAFDVIADGLLDTRGSDPRRVPDPLDHVAAGARRLRRALRNRRRSPWWEIEATVEPEARLGDGVPELAGRPLDYLGTELYRRWWPSQRSFALPSFSDLHLRVNLAGREGSGRVDRRRYAAELDRLEALLCACRDPRTGRPVVADVRRLRAADPGDEGAPPADLAALAAEPVDALEHPSVGRVGPLPFLRTGEHGGRGFVAVLDPAGPPRLPARLSVAELGRVLRDLAFRQEGTNLQPFRGLS